MNLFILFFQKFRNLFTPSTYEESAQYGLLHILREMLHFPKWLPLPTWPQHGMYINDSCAPSDLQHAKEWGSVCLYNTIIKQDWNKHSVYPCFVTGPLMIRYRHFKQWDQKENASGTIFFASHSIQEMRMNYSLANIKRVLNDLPPEFQPVTVCLHWFDYYELHMDSAYEEMGFRTVTAGRSSKDFVKNYYDIITQFKYACSNDIGTYVLFALDLGIPFFMIGDLPSATVIEQTADLPDTGDYDLISSPKIKYIYSLFQTGPLKEITPEQKQWFREETGIDATIDLQELRSALIRISLRNFLFPRLIWKRLKNYLLQQ